MTDLNLSPSQAIAWRDIVENGRSGFLTGGAGTGKSYLIQNAVKQMRENGSLVAVTGTTGIAAVLNSGVTVNSFFRIRPDDLLPANKFDAIKRASDNYYFKKMIRKINTLIIDEASMLSVELYELIDNICSATRKHRHLPFGGLQVVLVGDFFQLPPVSKTDRKYLFESKLFWQSMGTMWDLREIWRQTDPLFCDLLGRMRIGETNEEDIALLKTHLLKDISKGDIKATIMYAKRVDVDTLNNTELQKLDTESYSYAAKQLYFDADHEEPKAKKFKPSQSAIAVKESMITENHNKLLKELNFDKVTTLKIGAQVMLTSNLDTENGLANGTRGIITGFRVAKNPDADSILQENDDETRQWYPSTVLLPLVHFGNKTVLIPYAKWTRTIHDLGEFVLWHLPLRLAWASTIHRAQGQTLDLVDISLDSSVFEVGQAYVAVSRAKSLEGLRFSAFDQGVIRTDTKVKEFYSRPFETQRFNALKE
jgi:ATP-dependent DNA helicase PIF1